MCGIFAYIEKGADSDGETMRIAANALFRLSESRGKEAAGIAAIEDDRIRIYKEPLAASRFIKQKKYRALFEGPLQGFVGHARLVTSGAMELSSNNQPVVSGGIACVHNGIIVNVEELWKKYSSLVRKAEVDTEIIPALVGHFMSGGDSPMAALQKTLREIVGTASIALFFEKSDSLLFASNNRSLYTARTDIMTVAASEYGFLRTFLSDAGHEKVRIHHVKPDEVVELPLLKSMGRTFETLSADFETKPIVPTPISVQVYADFEKEFAQTQSLVDMLKRCSKCILPETMPFIEFDGDGVCNYCRNYKAQKPLGREALASIMPRRCLVPFSGGRDSSYALHLLKTEFKTTPVAFSYDWGMITDLGRRNQARMCGALGIEHIWVSADIKNKRANIRRNVLAWMKHPDLGMVPLFMAGDKQYFYHANKLMREMDLSTAVYGENPLEKTDFKTGFCGVPPTFNISHVYQIGLSRVFRLAGYYASQFVRNPAYFNKSLLNSMTAFFASYFATHDYLYLYRYIPWNEKEINETLIERYDWETAEDTSTTWRIGDGTAPLYNYIYFALAGFTEHDTFRSNQVREGAITREQALAYIEIEHRPRWPSLKWYCDTIGIDLASMLERISAVRLRQ